MDLRIICVALALSLAGCNSAEREALRDVTQIVPLSEFNPDDFQDTSDYVCRWRETGDPGEPFEAIIIDSSILSDLQSESDLNRPGIAATYIMDFLRTCEVSSDYTGFDVSKLPPPEGRDPDFDIDLPTRPQIDYYRIGPELLATGDADEDYWRTLPLVLPRKFGQPVKLSCFSDDGLIIGVDSETVSPWTGNQLAFLNEHSRWLLSQNDFSIWDVEISAEDIEAFAWQPSDLAAFETCVGPSLYQ